MRASQNTASLKSEAASRGVVVSVNDDGKMQLITVKMHGGEKFTDIELFHPGTMSHNPLPGAEVVVSFLNGNRSHPIATIAPDRRHRKTGLKPGETAFSDQWGNLVHMTGNGIIAETMGEYRIKAGKVVLDSSEILLGGDGADKPVGILGSKDVAGHALVSDLSTVVKTL